MKVLVCSNHSWPNGDRRTRWSFAELLNKNHITDFQIMGHGDTNSDHRKIFQSRLKSALQDFKPDLVIWHKDSGNDLDEEFVQQVAKLTCLVYHDLDPWQKFLKPTQRNQQILSKYSRRVFLCGLGTIADQFPAGGDRIRYSPHAYCDPDVPEPVTTRKRNLVFIGSVHRRFKPVFGRFGPEQHAGRTAAVGTLRSILGQRFIAHGMGYPSKWGIKPCPFDEQFVLVNENLASFTIDACPGAPFYFSNRTPFSLACGSIHIKIARPGDGLQFGNCPGLISVKDPGQAAEAFSMIASWSEERLKQIALDNKQFAKENFREPDIYRALIEESVRGM